MNELDILTAADALRKREIPQTWEFDTGAMVHIGVAILVTLLVVVWVKAQADLYFSKNSI